MSCRSKFCGTVTLFLYLLHFFVELLSFLSTRSRICETVPLFVPKMWNCSTFCRPSWILPMASLVVSLPLRPLWKCTFAGDSTGRVFHFSLMIIRSIISLSWAKLFRGKSRVFIRESPTWQVIEKVSCSKKVPCGIEPRKFLVALYLESPAWQYLIKYMNLYRFFVLVMSGIKNNELSSLAQLIL